MRLTRTARTQATNCCSAWHARGRTFSRKSASTRRARPSRSSPCTRRCRNRLEGWRGEVAAGKSGPRTYRVTIPIRALGDRALASGDRILLALRYVDDGADGLPPVPLTWGGGLDGSHSTIGYEWLNLTSATGP